MQRTVGSTRARWPGNRDAFLGRNRSRSRAITGEYCNASDDCREREQCCCHPRPTLSCAALLERLDLFGQLGIAEILCEEIDNVEAHAVLDFAFAEVVQGRLPMSILIKIFGDTLEKQDVSRIPAVHHPLRQVNPRTSDIGALVHIDHAADWAAMHPHPELQLRMLFERPADF